MGAVSSILGSGPSGDSRPMQATQARAVLAVRHFTAQQATTLTDSMLQEELRNAKVDLAYRDFCAHLLIPLNQCRRDSFYLPWKCEHERHDYEKCQYFEYKRRLLHANS